MKGFTILFLAAAACQLRAQVVYNNMTGMNLFEGTLSSGFNASPEEGDQLTLGPGGRTLIDAKSIIRGVFDTGNTNPFNYDVTMRLRSLVGGVPSTVLYSNTVQVRGLTEGANTMDWALPNIVVQDTVVMTFSFVRQGGNTGSVGIDFGGAPTVGTSDANMYWTTGFSGVFQQANFPITGRANMAAQLTAAPEPASMIGLALGAFGLARRHTRKTEVVE